MACMLACQCRVWICTASTWAAPAGAYAYPNLMFAAVCISKGFAALRQVCFGAVVACRTLTLSAAAAPTPRTLSE